MQRMLLALVAVLVCVSAFIAPQHAVSRSKQILMGTNPVASGYSTTKAGKAIVVERTKKLIADSQLIISVPSGGISKEQIDELRKLMPKTSKCSTVKNTLMNVALQGSEFEALGESLKRENMFFFIPEGEAKATYAGFKKWQKDNKRTGEDQLPKHSIMNDGKLYEGEKNAEMLANLPTKKDLIQMIAIGIKAVPTKVGRGVGAVPNKLGRAFGALKEKIAEDESAK